jgi:tetratricopeptide (TPR) repeat protein
MAESTKALFLSYASQDAAAARRHAAVRGRGGRHAFHRPRAWRQLRNGRQRSNGSGFRRRLGHAGAAAGSWERGLALAGRAKQLNPHHPGYYWFADFYNSYRQGDYRGALSSALKVNLPGHYGTHAVLAAAYGQLGERNAGEKALQDLLKLRPDFASTVRAQMENWWAPEYVEHFIDGLRKAGLEVAAAREIKPS